MAVRMLDYAIAIQRAFGRYPRQFVLYVGQAPLRMVGELDTPELSFRCRIMDIREPDGEPLLESAPRHRDDGIDNSGGSEESRTCYKKGDRECANPDRHHGARPAGPYHEVGSGHWLGGRTGRRTNGSERTLLLNMIAKRFGSVPVWTVQRLESLDAPELELGLRLLDARTLEDLFA
jgi:hypothetical protein